MFDSEEPDFERTYGYIRTGDRGNPESLVLRKDARRMIGDTLEMDNVVFYPQYQVEWQDPKLGPTGSWRR
ncbi:MAG: hypothetical protein QF793_00760 [Candidatus Peribacteraceae bacterium]|jgi:hypothetical protein|nr:hypothetical protein [bacterium]MDP6561437.1 hypothetical protein [Candidatus Peribacteraceae bacterium]|tara:strand:- start:140 stop:349 length:210 start_codon:yes stop_codon:yes gene_type:complete